MTDYITIYGVKKRSFVIQAKIPELSDSAMTRINADDMRVARNGDMRVARNGDTRVARNSTPNVYPRILGIVKKRSFVLQAKVNHG